MKLAILGVCAFLASVLSASAQAVIVVGPASVIEWQVPGVGTPANAMLLTYGLIVDVGTPKILAGVACTQGPAANQTCTVPAAGNAPIGTHALTLTASDGVTTSVPSASFSYVTLLVPIPTGLRIR